MSETSRETKLLETLVARLDLPRSYYEKAAARHKSLGEWLCRPESRIAPYNPHVFLQGSFRYGTVIPPFFSGDEYDLDDVTTLDLAKTAMTQRQLKQLYGDELKAYAKAHGILAPVEDKDRCWRLAYADDDLKFHLDSLPCIPEEWEVIQTIAAAGVGGSLAGLAVAITDKKHPQYDQITRALRTSNSRGFAEWFVNRARPVAVARMRQLVEGRLYASVDDVPPYEWKTPLQRVIQILKRHRDVMFRDKRDVAPISMIITCLAAHAYRGETDLWAALAGIVEGMTRYIQPAGPRIPNPANPLEDYAERWAQQPTLEENFWSWHTQVKVDIGRLSSSVGVGPIAFETKRSFDFALTEGELSAIRPHRGGVSRPTAAAAPALYIPAGPAPWGHRD